MNHSNFKKKVNLRTLIVCALPAEAKPIIAEFKLKHVQSEYAFKRYADTTGRLGLLVTGAGKVNMASALMWSQQLQPAFSFLNVGVMGHGSAQLGSCYLINKVIDVATNRSFYPVINFKWRDDVGLLSTVDQAQELYVKDQGVDMEASAFMQIARRFVSTESVHMLKIVSDNPSVSFKELNAVKVQKLIEDNINLIRKMLNFLEPVLFKSEEIEEILPDETFSAMQEKWHITVSQQQQLFNLSQSINVVAGNTHQKMLDWRDYATVKEYLFALRVSLKSHSPKL